MIKVAMAFILNDLGKVLIAKRNSSKPFGGLWEFPGGKIKIDETPEAAVIRELREELLINVRTINRYPSYFYLDSTQNIEFFPIQCSLEHGKPVCVEHESICEIELEKINEYDFAPPDYKAIEILKKEYLNMLKIASLKVSESG